MKFVNGISPSSFPSQPFAAGRQPSEIHGGLEANGSWLVAGNLNLGTTR